MLSTGAKNRQVYIENAAASRSTFAPLSNRKDVEGRRPLRRGAPSSLSDAILADKATTEWGLDAGHHTDSHSRRQSWCSSAASGPSRSCFSAAPTPGRILSSTCRRRRSCSWATSFRGPFPSSGHVAPGGVRDHVAPRSCPEADDDRPWPWLRLEGRRLPAPCLADARVDPRSDSGRRVPR